MGETVKPSAGQATMRALLWMTGALASFSTVAITGRGAGQYVSALEIVFWRNVVGVVLLLAIALATSGLSSLRTEQFGLQAVRNVFHFIGQTAWLLALSMITLAELFALEFTAPLWVAVLAPLLIGEKLTASRIAAAVLGFIGTLIVIRPGTASLGPGSLLGLTAALGFALSLIATKRLTRTDGAMPILWYMSFLQAIVGGILLVIIGFSWPPLAAWPWLVTICIAGLTAHYSLTRAFALADAIIVVPMDFLRLPLIAVVGLVLYGEPMQIWVMIGASVIVAANFLNIWGERRRVTAAARAATPAA